MYRCQWQDCHELNKWLRRKNQTRRWTANWVLARKCTAHWLLVLPSNDQSSLDTIIIIIIIIVVKTFKGHSENMHCFPQTTGKELPDLIRCFTPDLPKVDWNYCQSSYCLGHQYQKLELFASKEWWDNWFAQGHFLQSISSHGACEPPRAIYKGLELPIPHQNSWWGVVK